MDSVIKAVYNKNRAISKTYPKTFVLQRLICGLEAIGFPLFIYYFIFKRQISVSFYERIHTTDYLTYIILGQSLNILSFSTLMNVGRCIISEIREGTLEVLLISPASRVGYFIGCYLEQLFLSIVEFLIIILLGIMLGAKITFDNIVILSAIVIIASTSFLSLSITIASIMVFTRDSYLTQNTLFNLMSVICGVSYPIEYLPPWLQPVSALFPLTPTLKLFRNCILNNQTLAMNGFVLLHIFIISLIYLLLGYKWFTILEKKFIENIYS